MTLSHSTSPSESDQELLSAYLDNQLSAVERATIERRLRDEPLLQGELAELRALKTMLGDMPALVPPRSFTLDPATVGKPRGMPLFALLRLGGVLATLLLALTLTLDLVTPAASPSSSAVAPQLQAAATTAPAAAAPLQQKAPAESSQGPTEGEGGAAASESAATPQAVGDVAAGSALNSPQATIAPPQAAEAPPALRAMAPTLSAGNTSSPDTDHSALPPVTTTQPRGLGPLRWTQIILAALALGCAIGALLARQQQR